MPRRWIRTMLYGKTCLPATRWLFDLTSSRTARRISANSGASFVIWALKGASKIERPNLSIQSETGIGHLLGSGLNDSEVTGGFDQRSGDRGGDLGAIAAMFDYDCECDTVRRVGVVRCESGKPRVREALVHLRGPGLAGSFDIQTVQCAAAGAAGHYGTHRFG